jgi:Lrp/AsnC family transcriptional regulator for asnA, asnC and gidA
MYKIDETNVEIINLLMDDGRMSCAEIAQRLGTVSERSIRYRINRMVQEGIIQICAVPTPEKLGFPVTADVFIKVESAYILDVAQRLAEYECISYVGCALGETDVSVQIFAPDNVSVYEFVTKVIAKMEGVSHTRTAILPHILKDFHQWRVPRSLGLDVYSKRADEPIQGGEQTV